MTDRQRRNQQQPSNADDSSSGNDPQEAVHDSDSDESLSSSADAPVAEPAAAAGYDVAHISRIRAETSLSSSSPSSSSSNDAPVNKAVGTALWKNHLEETPLSSSSPSSSSSNDAPVNKAVGTALWKNHLEDSRPLNDNDATRVTGAGGARDTHDDREAHDENGTAAPSGIVRDAAADGKNDCGRGKADEVTQKIVAAPAGGARDAADVDGDEAAATASAVSTSIHVPKNTATAPIPASAIESNKESKSNDDGERRLKERLVALESKHVVEAIEATSKAEHNVPKKRVKDMNLEEKRTTNATTDKPSATDVLFGNGIVIARHPGNRTFRRVVQSKSLTYDAAKRNEKNAIQWSIVHEMKEKLHLRFLKEDEKTGFWIEVTNNDIIREKVAGLLRTLRKARRRPPAHDAPNDDGTEAPSGRAHDESDFEDPGTTKKRKRAGGGGGAKKKQGAAKKATTANSGGRVSMADRADAPDEDARDGHDDDGTSAPSGIVHDAPDDAITGAGLVSQFTIKGTSLVYQTKKSGRMYVHPNKKYDDYQPGDIDCEVIEQYVTLTPAQARSCERLNGSDGSSPRVWRCKRCVRNSGDTSFPKGKRFLSVQERHQQGDWYTLSQWKAYIQCPPQFLERYQYYYRLSHLIIMRDVLHFDGDANDLPKGLAYKIGKHCSIHSLRVLKKIISEEGNKWEEVKVILKNTKTPSLNDDEIQLLVKRVDDVNQTLVDKWFHSAENGNDVFLRTCKYCSTEYRRMKDAGKTKKKKQNNNEKKQREANADRRRRIQMMALKNETVCKNLKCSIIIHNTDSEKIKLMNMNCRACFQIQQKMRLTIRKDRFEEKQTREEKCQSNYLGKIHQDSKEEKDIVCYFANYPCDACTKHHHTYHKKIETIVDVPNKTFCGCPLNCILYPDRGRGYMGTLRKKIVDTLNKDIDILSDDVNTFVEKQKLIFDDGHKELTNEQAVALKKKVLDDLSMTIVGKSQEWDHHNPNQKNFGVTQISNKRRREKEIEYCVLMDTPCHRFKSMIERMDEKDDDDGVNAKKNAMYIMKWKREQFKKNDSCCTLLQGMYGKDVSCPFGHGTHEECEAQIQAVRAFLNNNGKRNVSASDFYLKGCFDIHHDDPNAKKGNWNDMVFAELKELLEEQGRLTCYGCHKFVTTLLRHFRGSEEDNDSDIEM